MKRVGQIIDQLREDRNFSPRHQNPYLAKSLELSGILYTEKEMAAEKKYADSLFSIKQPVVIEIGCYLGKTLLELCQKNPTLNFLGLDITYKRVVKSGSRLCDHKLENGKVVMSDARLFFSQFVRDQSLGGVCVFFPDPWSKDRQEKHRLFRDEFVGTLKQKLKADGFVWLKTDSESYFKQAHDVLLKQGFNLICNENDEGLKIPTQLNDSLYETNFQELFRKQGISYYSGIYGKSR